MQQKITKSGQSHVTQDTEDISYFRLDFIGFLKHKINYG